VAEAELIAVSAESSLVQKFCAELLGEREREPEGTRCEQPARVLKAVRDE
jgi:hypothetical protein